MGYFDIDDKNYKKYSFHAPFLGSERDFKFSKNDKVLLAIGEQKQRKKVLQYFAKSEENVEFISFVHHSANIAKTAILGKANVICPNVVVGPNVILGDYNLLNYNSSIAHDCALKDMNVLSPNVCIAGYCRVGSENFFGICSGMKPSLSIGDKNKIQANLVLDRKLDDDNIFFSMQKTKVMRNLIKG
ncbi:UDP-N-acetylbacillosamine N-acetyltransferase [Campylobacter suis]|uniref:UDP-N-acetylbacillosamine N-acetyltransferase n=1 Tax=Campylobacter suis TaxID=2790657 RepID=A0ABM8Q7E2_9BACT|nr:UDP-N-acetylbacillosamine N-acetyltransferase [Campylobacter suis]